MGIVVRVLGPLEALIDGEPVDLGPPQQRTLLALLALHGGKTVRLATIEEVLWDDEPPASSTKVVQTYVSRLRKLLGAETIRFTGHGYVLDVAVDVDAARFRELVDRGENVSALTLWRGPVLSGLPAIAGQAPELDELRVSAIEARMEAALDAGEGPELVAELRQLVAEHPTRERLLAQLVLALYRGGRQAEALAAYRGGREELVEGLGLEPSQELRELERRILRQDPTLMPAASAASVASGGRRRRWMLGGIAAAAAVGAAAIVSATVFGGNPRAVPIRANTLLELNPTNDRFVGSIPIARDATALKATRSALWIGSERERTVSRIDLATRRVTTIGEPHPVSFLARDERGNVYASGWDFPFIWQIDPETIQIVRTFRVPGRALGLAVGGGSLWAVDRFGDAVTRVDLAERRVAEEIKVGAGANPLAASFGYGALWVANGDAGTVAVIRPGATDPIAVRGIPSPFGISAGAGGVWVASNGAHAVYRIDPDTHAIVARIDLGTPTDFLSGVTAGPHEVWAVEDHHVVRIDPATDRVVARIRFPAGTEPKAIAATATNVWISVGDPKDDL